MKSYQVIARKWRPQTFEELIGQEHVTQTLLNALKNQRLPHALLFTGVRGVGKTSAARILAKSLKCPKANPIPCDQCAVCQNIARGSSIDVMEIDGASHNGVDAIRDIIEKVSYLPMQGKYKLCIIDEVHMLSISAFNALLKTLEEPPQHIKFVFATTEVQKIPRTILSRCQTFHFRPIPTKVISKHLQKICEAEGVQMEKEALWHIARQGEGSMRDAQSLLDQTITFANGKITQDQVMELLGVGDRQLVLETLTALLHKDSRQILQIVFRLYTSGYDLKVFLNDLMEAIKNLLFIKECLEDSSGLKISQFVDLPDTEIAALKDLAQNVQKQEMHQIFDMALKGGMDVVKARDSLIVLEMLLLKMAHTTKANFKQEKRPQRPMDPPIKHSSNQPSQKLSTPPVSTSPIKTIPHTSNPSDKQTDQQEVFSKKEPSNGSGQVMSSTSQLQVSQTDSSSVRYEPNPRKDIGLEQKAGNITSDQLKAFISKVKEQTPLLGAQLMGLSLQEIKENVLILSVPSDRFFLLSKLQSKQTLNELAKQALTFWNKNWTFEFQITQTKTAPSPMKGVQRTSDDLTHGIRHLPEVQKIQSILGAKVQSVVENDNRDG